MTDTGRRITLAAVLIALPFAVAACSSSSSSASPQNAASGQSTTAPLGQPSAPAGGNGDGKFPAACSLLTQDQAKTALGDDVAPGVEQQAAGGNGSSCTFDGAGAADDVIIQVGPAAFIHQIQGTHQTQPVPALGPDAGALVYGLGADIYDIYAAKGATAVDISISKGGKGSDPETLPPPPVADALTALAKTALGKL
ncbi:hypothetical protein ABH920_002821 [Catenulispora sp. EB89]|uniref:hypothetical protein n=1 Tax=Catenulispora sp. EB89 TaxID=3156257 RepID=UPI00351140CD